MYQTLEEKHFGPKYITYIKTMYQNIEACVMNNNMAIPVIISSQKNRQGCPISAYLFILVVETMANAIKTIKKSKVSR